MDTLNRVVLRDQVKDYILQRIVAGEYAPGQRVEELHEAYPVRAVLEALAAEQATARITAVEPRRPARLT